VLPVEVNKSCSKRAVMPWVGAWVSLLRQHSAEMSASACTRSIPGVAFEIVVVIMIRTMIMIIINIIYNIINITFFVLIDFNLQHYCLLGYVIFVSNAISAYISVFFFLLFLWCVLVYFVYEFYNK